MTISTQTLPSVRSQERLGIGAAARAAGISVKRVRHYEAIGLLPDVRRNGRGAREYGFADIHTLRFIGRARSLGFSLDDVRKLLSLWQDPHRSNRDTLHLSEIHLKGLVERRLALDSITSTLRQPIEACDGDGRPDCPIIDDLSAINSGSGSEPSPNSKPSPEE